MITIPFLEDETSKNGDTATNYERIARELYRQAAFPKILRAARMGRLCDELAFLHDCAERQSLNSAMLKE